MSKNISMRILHVGKFYHPTTGGIETVLRSLSEGLVGAGHEVEVLCFAGSRRGSRENIAGVEVTRAPTFGSLMSQPICPSLRQMMSTAATSADVVHVHSPNPLAEYAALKLPESTPLVCTYHADVVRQRMVLPAYRPLLRRFLDRCDRIVVATDKHIEHSKVLAPRAEQCEVIPFGLAPERFVATERTKALADRLRHRHGSFVLFVGRLVGYKGLRYLIDAMRDVPGELLIVGDGPLAGGLGQQIEAAGLQDRVHLVGEVPDDEDLLAYYHACSVFALPSITRAEAFGMVLAEAMACGKPLVTANLKSGVTFVNKNQVNGLQAEPGDVLGLRRALREVLLDETLAEQLGEAGRARFHAEFTTETMVTRHAQLYESLRTTIEV